MHNKFETTFNTNPMLQLGSKLNPIKLAQEYTFGVLRCLDLLILYSFQRLLGEHFMQFYQWWKVHSKLDV
jgi:hypothetical protein